jgi:hypothetical protein
MKTYYLVIDHIKKKTLMPNSEVLKSLSLHANKTPYTHLYREG